MTVQDILDHVYRVERPQRIEMLSIILKSPKVKYLNNRQVWKVIINIWTDTEFPSLSIDLWKQIFSVRKVPPHLTKCLSEEMTVYRGGEPDGISWTLDKEKGEWFSNRSEMMTRLKQPLCSMRVKRDDVLFFTDERNENEVVIFPTNQRVEYLN